MALADRIKAKLDGALRRVGPTGRTAYKRIYTRTGGDDLIGRPGSTTYTDTLFNPQPVYSRADENDALTLLAGQGAQPADDYLFVFSLTALTTTDLMDKDLAVVLKNSAGHEEVFHVVDYESLGIAGKDAALFVRLRSTDRP